MSYNYQEQRARIFTDEGQRAFLKVRDEAARLLEEAGAFMMFNPLRAITDDSWLQMAYVDRLVELGEIREITPPRAAGHRRVFVRAEQLRQKRG